jgi:hypothetical protein
MTLSNYSRRENGRKAISDAEWTRIAKVLDVNKETIYEAYRNHTSLESSVNVPFESVFEAEYGAFNNSKNTTPQSYNIPKELLDNQQEYITILKIENDTLKQENKFLKEKLLIEKKKNNTTGHA